MSGKVAESIITETPDKANRKIQVTYRQLRDLRLDPNNPRVHGAEQINRIARSVESFGFNSPVLVDASLKVLAGHGRVLACRQLGWTEVPTVLLEHLSEAQARAYVVADNRLTDLSAWDDHGLAQQLKELSALTLDFDLEAIGFDVGEIDFRIEQLTAESDQADEIPEAPVGPPVSRRGDLWRLDKNRVLCADALDEGSYVALMEGGKAAAAICDPPYNVKINGHVSGHGRTRHREFPMASGEMSQAEFTEFLTRACTCLVQHTSNGSLHYLFQDWRHMTEILAAGRGAYGELKNLCVWTKDNAGMGSLYRSQHELIFVFRSGKETNRNNIQLGRFGRNRTNVWRYPGANTFARASNEGNLLALHPTIKPVAMIADAIMDCTARGDIVLDAFLGSGTTVIAAERTGRRCYGLELDPHYVDIIVQRWQKMTRKVATHDATGLSLEQLKKHREGPDA